MFELLFSTISTKVALTSEEFDTVVKFFKPKKLRKRQFFLNYGDICHHLAFVSKGCMKSYITDEKGQERIIQFAIEDFWISNMTSMMSGEPSQLDIEAIEDSELLVIEKEDRELLFEKVPKMETYFRKLQQISLVEQQNRITSAIVHSAEEKYADFVKRNPNLLQRVPQHMIASYLGISAETLSRNRAKRKVSV